MIIFLRILFILILAGILSATLYAGSQVPLWNIPPEVTHHPWFVATLVDTYFAFLCFYLWVFSRESKAWVRAFWFVLIMALGNIAMSIYVLMILFRLPSTAKWKDILLQPEKTARA